VRDAGSRGRGVFAMRDFKRGEFIFRRRHARVVTQEELSSLSADEIMHMCELDWDRYAILLPPGCYLNHSCDPNAMRSGVKVFAWRDIRAGDEIVIDYRLNATGGERWECDCGSSSCLGYVHGGFFSMSDERQRDYFPYAPPFIRTEYHRRERGLPPRVR
ncbi:MAG TPA: SET domain-containing protein-lysine N-methyltransferase, partial [Dehalococcoidia bacterium]|nr:SET domain-containing protein-lysine N-methyltransferase [Dehalococcoidia bacterium]